MATQAKSQLGNPVALIIGGVILIVLGLVPGMPTVIFLSLGLGSGALAVWLSQNNALALSTDNLETNLLSENADPVLEELNWDDVEQVDLVGLDLSLIHI